MIQKKWYMKTNVIFMNEKRFTIILVPEAQEAEGMIF